MDDRYYILLAFLFSYLILGSWFKPTSMRLETLAIQQELIEMGDSAGLCYLSRLQQGRDLRYQKEKPSQQLLWYINYRGKLKGRLNYQLPRSNSRSRVNILRRLGLMSIFNRSCDLLPPLCMVLTNLFWQFWESTHCCV
jgi:hypothetical protein